MSIITKIRNNSWIIVVMVGLGMGGFLLMDAINSRTGIFGNSTTIGEIDGREVSVQEFTKLQEELFKNQPEMSRFEQTSSLWEYLVQTTLMRNTAEKMGIGVGKAELEDLMTGMNMSPAVQRVFTNPQTRQLYQEFGQFAQLYKTNKKDINKYFQIDVKSLEDQAIGGAMTQKLISMVQKSVYTPKWMLEMEQQRTLPIDFKFVPVPFASVKDAEVPVTDAELKAYISDHAKLFTNEEETRTAGFAMLTVAPSSADSTVARKKIEEHAVGLRAATTISADSTYFADNYGNFSGMFFKKDQLPPYLKDTAFKMPVGSIIGPYIDNDNYYLAKIVARQSVVDSVRSRHILIPVKEGTSDASAKAKVDSLKKVAESGMSFDSLAKQFGTDATKDKGGDLGFAGYGGMVKPFNDLIFFKAQIGTLYTLKTQFGWHLVQVKERKGSSEMVKIGSFNEVIAASDATTATALAKANQLREKCNTTAELEKMAKTTAGWQWRTTPNLKRNDFAGGDLEPGESSRNIIKWLYSKGSVGDVSPAIYNYENKAANYTNKYVIAGLQRITPKGLQAIEDVRDQVALKVRNQKKADIIIKKIGAQTDMTAVGALFQSEVKDAGSASMNAPFVPGLGAEPKVIAAAWKTPLNATSKPVIGDNGVFMVQPINKATAQPLTPEMIPNLRRQLDGQMLQQAGQTFFQALRKNASVTDNRFNFF